MRDWTIFVVNKPAFVDHHGEALKKEAARAGLKGLKKVRTGAAYGISGAEEADARRLAEGLLADSVTQAAEIVPAGGARPPSGARRAQVWPKAGVADPVADTVRMAARDLGVTALSAVRSGKVYDFFGAARPDDVRRFCEDHLMNALVQKVDVL